MADFDKQSFDNEWDAKYSQQWLKEDGAAVQAVYDKYAKLYPNLSDNVSVDSKTGAWSVATGGTIHDSTIEQISTELKQARDNVDSKYDAIYNAQLAEASGGTVSSTSSSSSASSDSSSTSGSSTSDSSDPTVISDHGKDYETNITYASSAADTTLAVAQADAAAQAAEQFKNATERENSDETEKDSEGNSYYDVSKQNGSEGTSEINPATYAQSLQNFKLPDWTYSDFVQELNAFRKGTTAFGNDPGWFYFKIFFHFDDTYGLLANILANTSNTTNNSAYNYLNSRKNIYQYDNLRDRTIALKKFVTDLSKINTNTPWFFEKISGLDKAGVLLNDMSKEKTIEISCIEDAIDMRLTTLFHLYQYACFDEINQKEIIPENLRKFNMSVIIYHIPLRKYNNVLNATTGSTDAQHTSGSDFSNRMSYKLFNFIGCEFDLESLKSIIPSSATNNTPFQLAKNSIKITYNRCYTHLMNDFDQLFIGPDGIYFYPKAGITSGTNLMKQRISALATAAGNTSTSTTDWFIGENEEFYKEAEIDHTLGNVYNLDIRQLKFDVAATNITTHVYLSNIYDYVEPYFTALVVAKNRGATGALNGKVINMANSDINTRDLNNYRHILHLSTARRLYFDIWQAAATVKSPYEKGTEDCTNLNELFHVASFAEQYLSGTLYATEDYRTTIKGIVNNYVNVWKKLKSIWKNIGSSLLGQANNTLNSLKSTFSMKSFSAW